MTEQPAQTFESLAMRLSPALTRYLRKMTGSAADADDLLQETLMRMARALPRSQPLSSPTGWAYRIATNVAIDHLRKSRRVAFTELDDELEPDASPEQVDPEPLIVGEMTSCVRQVIDRLPPEHRAALVLLHLEGRSIREVAAICNISPTLAKVRAHRGKHRLKQVLEQECTFYESTAGVLRCDRKTSGC